MKEIYNFVKHKISKEDAINSKNSANSNNEINTYPTKLPINNYTKRGPHYYDKKQYNNITGPSYKYINKYGNRYGLNYKPYLPAAQKIREPYGLYNEIENNGL